MAGHAGGGKSDHLVARLQVFHLASDAANHTGPFKAEGDVGLA